MQASIDSETQTRVQMAKWKLRPDFDVSKHSNDGQLIYVLKDPIRLAYFQMQPAEYALLRLISNGVSVPDLLKILRNRYPEITIDSEGVRSFLIHCVNEGVMVRTEAGFGLNWAARNRRLENQQTTARWFSLLYHRFRGIDPTRLLNRIYPFISWCYRPAAIVVASTVVMIAVACLLSNWTRLVSELPGLYPIATFSNLPWLLIILCSVKVLHEFGHAMTCRHFNGECHEMGILVVGFLPLMYCDVTDTWSYESRWQRAAVSGAGIFVELMIAAICVILWSLSSDGLEHQLFLNTMLVCSLNTFLVNGNPLLRYDGYYVLSDVLGMPNLLTESKSKVWGFFNRIVWGAQSPIQTTTSVLSSVLMGAYGFAAGTYQLIVVSAILFLLHAVVKPYGLETIVVIPAILTFAGIGFSFIQKLRQGAQAAPSGLRSAAGGAVSLCIVVVVVCWPWPSSVKAPFVLSPGVSKPIYAPTDGYVTSTSQEGDSLTEGQSIARLSNPILELKFAELAGEHRLLEMRLALLRQQRFQLPQNAEVIPETEELLASVSERQELLKQKIQLMKVDSPIAGELMFPRNRPATKSAELELHEWTGHPLQPEQAGGWLEKETLLAWVGDKDSKRAIAYVELSQADRISAGATVSLRFLSKPSNVISGAIDDVAQSPRDEVSRELLANQFIMGEGNQSNQSLLAVRIRLDEGCQMPLYCVGYCKIQSRPMNALERIWRTLCETFPGIVR